MPFVREINDNDYGIITLSGKQLGVIQTLSSPGVDRWKWSAAPFPPEGFTITFQTSGSTQEGTNYPDYPFLTSTSVPTRQWPGSSNLYSISKNGTLIGWFEANTSAPPDLMWWSNGQQLTNNRISVRAGDVLAYSPIANLPTFAVRPLQSTQSPL